MDDRRARAVWRRAAGGVHESEQRIAYVAQPVVAAYRLQQEKSLSSQFNRPCEFDEASLGYRDNVSANQVYRPGFGLSAIPVSQDVVLGYIVLLHCRLEAGCRSVKVEDSN